jgi:hypothetical protein
MPTLITRGAASSYGFGFGSTPAVLADPYFNYTTLLLPGNGTNGAQNNTFLDSSSNNFSITRNGDTTQGTFSPFSLPAGTWSNYFPGSSSIQMSSSSSFNINTYDTLECWVNLSVLGTNNLFLGREANYWLGYNHTSIGGTANKFVFSIYNGSSWQAVSSSTSPSAGVWYHILGVKDNTTLRIYINGVQENTATFSGSPSNSSYNVFVGANNTSESTTGYVSNARLITGASNTVFPYSGLTTGASFTVPTSSLTNVSGTAFLTCQSNRFVDNGTANSGSGFTVSVNGTSSVQAFSPFLPTAAYSAATVGGSGYFDGSGDYLTIADNVALQLGSGDFCIEWWMYPTAAGSNPIMWGEGSGGGGNYFNIHYNISGNGKIQVFIDALSGSYVMESGVLSANAWTHVAVTRSGSTFRLFINGTQAATYSNAGSVNSGPLNIGSSYVGYISDSRTIKGSAVYTSNFTPPTAPLTAITNTQLLLNFTNAGILDNSAKNDLVTVGNAQISTAQSKFGGGSMYFDGTGDYLQNRLTDLTNFGTGDFTMECWIYPTASGSLRAIVDTRGTDINAAYGWFLSASDKLDFLYKGSSPFRLTSSGSVSTNTWTHVAVCRASGTLRLFINGNIDGSATVTDSLNGAAGTRIGGGYADGSGNPGFYLTGYIDDLRITKGIARYTGNFTPPTAAFPLK